MSTISKHECSLTIKSANKKQKKTKRITNKTKMKTMCDTKQNEMNERENTYKMASPSQACTPNAPTTI